MAGRPKRSKIVSAEQAVALVHDGDTICCNGFVQSGIPEELLIALEKRFLETGSPRNLTLFSAAGQADGKDRGLNRLGHEGMLRRAVSGNWGRMPKVTKLALENKIQGYNLPQGIISQLYRNLASGKPGTFSKVGMHTYVDPRLEGGRINEITKKDIVRLVEVDDEEWLFYKVAPVSVALIRGTTADTMGNITMERESMTLDTLAQAMAAKNSNGIVIVQVERIAERGSLNPRQVHIPGILVDCIVKADPENHWQSYATRYNPAYAGAIRVPLETMEPMPMSARKIIARRAAFELPPNGIVNLGVGVPEGVAEVARDENILDYITLTAESGTVGGVLASGPDFGAGVNIDAVVDQNQQFDFYDGGGLDMACLGMAECDEKGNVNVSRFGDRLIGCGGFINISQNARVMVFAGTFTAGGLEIAVENGQVHILKEGRNRKFVKSVQQVTFSGDYAHGRRQPVYYMTERCVFQRTGDGLELIEVAPGIDIKNDILAHMDFEPTITDPILMDPRIFDDEPMNLEAILLNLDLPERISYDGRRNILFLNYEALHVRTLNDVEAMRHALLDACEPIGKKVAVVVNYDSFRINEDVKDAFAEMAREMREAHYASVTRYATSAFMRMKFGGTLPDRGIGSHVFESKREARLFLGRDAGDLPDDPFVSSKE